MRGKVVIIVGIVLLIAGLCVLFYPTVTKMFSTQKINNVVEDFKSSVGFSGVPSTSDESGQNNPQTEASEQKGGRIPLTAEQSKRLYEEFCAYNFDLIENGQSHLGDPFAFEDVSVDLSEYGLEDSVVAVISAPAINMELPLYLGASEYNMYRGAAHLSKTSLPVGGESTNCVIAGHTGLVNAVMFDNIVKLEKGDDLYIINFWETLHYAVRETKIIEPRGSGEILIEKGSDLVTLITCYPYGSNTHRYLVICERVE